jgi:transcriptional regulator with XRE-family HTH domain
MKSEEPMYIALAKLLEEQEMTQAELCRAAGVSRGTVSRYLGGTRGTRIDARGARTVDMLASSLGVEPDYFVEYRAWRIRRITLADPRLMDDFYDLIIETARLRGLLE